MERRLATKITNHSKEFKDSLRVWLQQNNAVVVAGTADRPLSPECADLTGSFLRHVYDYPHLELGEGDFRRRRRVATTIPLNERCVARRAHGDRCTRRRRPGECFCGTHAKGAPHGVVDTDASEGSGGTKKVEIWVEPIKGIQYYLDAGGNVYSPEDVVAGRELPRVIAHWEKDEQGSYHIPDYGV